MAIDKAVDSTQLDSDLTSVANAIRTKGGTGAQLAFPTGFVSAVQAIPTGTTPSGTKQISITENGTVTEDVAAYASAEISVNVQGGGGVTFDDMATGDYSGDVVLTVNKIKEHAFGRSGITSVSSQSVTNVGANAFMECRQLITANFPGLINQSGSLIQTQMFINCTHMTNISFPELIWIADAMFRTCSSIVYGIFPKAEHIHQNSLFGCSCLQAVDVGAKSTGALTAANNLIHGIWAFSGCTVLNKLIIRQTNRIMTLNNINAFSSTPFADGNAGGTLYVPQALIADYQAATNWSTILGYANNSIQAIEGSAYENTYADGTPIT